MSRVKSLRHSRRECQFHVVFIPTYRKKAIFGQEPRSGSVTAALSGSAFRTPRLCRGEESVGLLDDPLEIRVVRRVLELVPPDDLAASNQKRAWHSEGVSV